jgi:GNAT superfamily N-acetyltransferase
MNNILEKMFQDYSEERGFGPRIYYTEFGFITYHLHKDEDECYIEDLYVVPEVRNKGFAARQLADYVCSVAKSTGVNKITGSINKLANNNDLSRKALVSYGMTKVNEDDEIEWYLKEI